MRAILRNMGVRGWAYLGASLVFIVVQVYFDLLMPDYMSEITRLVETPGSELSEVLVAGGAMLGCAAGSLVATVVASFFAARIAAGLSCALRERMFANVLTFSLAEVGRFSTLSLITRCTNDLTQIQLVNLLMGFYELDGGRILIDGTLASDIPVEQLRAGFAMVLQDSWLIGDTIRENITYGMDGVSDEDLRRAVHAAGLEHLVSTLPLGLDTVLDENAALSAGQRQLVTIARALLRDAPMLILDEATSSVDTRTEALIQRATDALTQGRMSFVIAHRLSTIRNADVILVLEDGDVVEQGTHDELMAAAGAYAALYQSQFEPEG